MELTPNQRAFADMIAFAEGTLREPDPYRVCYSYKHVIVDLREHPAVTREWMGEVLPDKMCIAANVPIGSRSTAAGKYQINKPTWLWIRGVKRLSDFSPQSQDAACIGIIAACNALDDIEAGRLGVAVTKCRKRWASLPGAGWNQPERRIGDLARAFVNAGGTLSA